MEQMQIMLRHQLMPANYDRSCIAAARVCLLACVAYSAQIAYSAQNLLGANCR
jgi:hypothetical protein